MRDRRIGFCYQEVPAVRAIQDRWSGKKLTTALGVYLALTFVANDRRSREDFVASRAEVAAVAGVSRSTLDKYVSAFEELGLVEVERRKAGEKSNLPNAWTLLSGWVPSSATEQGVAQPTAQYDPEKKEQEEGSTKEKKENTTDQVESVFTTWVEATERSAAQCKLTPERKRLIEKWLKLYPVEDLVDCMRGIGASKFHRGENDRRTRYDTLELALRNAEKIEGFRDEYRDKGTPASQVEAEMDAHDRAFAGG